MDRPGQIVFFDSGVGGISVLARARHFLPDENLLYYADQQHAPYGNHSTQEVIDLVSTRCDYFVRRGVKAIVLACNTATSAAAEYLRARLPIPVLGIEPALNPAIQATSGRVLVMATQLTIQERKYQLLLERLGTGRDVVSLACPGLMELIERDPSGKETQAYLCELLKPYQPEIAALVLGCTHYVFARPLLSEIVPQAGLFDGAEGLCRHLAHVLDENNLRGGEGTLEWDCSAANETEKLAYIQKMQRFFELPGY